jgi:hypothetical protein
LKVVSEKISIKRSCFRFRCGAIYKEHARSTAML